MQRETVCNKRTERNCIRKAGQAAHLSQGFARETAAWLEYIDPQHEAGELINQRITTGTVRVTEVWTDNRHDDDEQLVELDCEMAVTLTNVTEGAARTTVLTITQTEPSHRFAAWRAG